MMDEKTKLAIVRVVPWWVLRALWKCRIVERETIFQWEMNIALGEWQ